MIELTIFTPTYNRAYILPQLFDSLLAQTNKNFEWLIVDDGSSDNTKNLIEDFKSKADFKIIYICQENQGKHVAINTALSHIKTAYFATVDSDDFLQKNGIEIVEKKIPSITQENKIIGIASPINILNNTARNKKDIDRDIAVTTNELKFKYGYEGELTLIFKTDLAKKFEYPIFKGEKFMLESVVFDRMDSDYKFLYINASIVNAEYREDGLTAQGKKLLLNNPQGSALAYKQKMNNSKIPLNHRKIFAKNYWDYESLNNKSFVSKLNNIQSLQLKLHMIGYFIKRILDKK
ncbi:glycosyltransferase family A protein [Chryseobacterium sp. YIM B08800]|uniref:glycosyltransferase family A protein n=1 Tax=Chryseobacterium sp. YIM B08800 TaxID=2984136 RepID=UPI002240460B|nr:glycosyltransferase family A protein [Chryseobacterium sp. YIM B08800]